MAISSKTIALGTLGITLLLCVGTPAFAIEVSGDVSGHWTIDESPVHVTDDAEVPEEEELVIDPGVVVLFSRDTWLRINGRLTAEGTEEDSIIFTADADEPEHGFWSWISISRSGEGSLTYCIIEFAETGIGISGFPTEVAFSTIRYMLIYGVRFEIDGEDRVPRVHHCRIYDVIGNGNLETGVGVHIVVSRGRADHNVITNCVIGAIGALWDYAIYEHNIIAYNEVGFEGGWESHAQCNHNIFYNNDIVGYAEEDPFYYNCYLGERREDDMLFLDIDRENANGTPCDEWFNINQDPLFVVPLHGDFRLRPDSPCIDAGNPDAEEDPDGSVPDIGLIPFDPDVLNDIDHTVLHLTEGWNMISSPIAPYTVSVRHVLGPLLNRYTLLFAKDIMGRFFSPEMDFSNMSDWDVHQGYMVKISDVDTLLMVGEGVPFDEPIPLLAGWNIAPYFPAEELEAPDAFASILDNLIIAKNQEGHFFVPDLFNGMEPLRPGSGYMVKVTEDCELVYPEGQERLNYANDRRSPRFESGLQNTGENLSVLLNGAIPGAVYEIVGEGGTVYGSDCADECGYCGIAVWGDDPTTLVKDGASEGEPLYLCLMSETGSESLDACWQEGSAVYIKDGFLIASLDGSPTVKSPSEFLLSEPYPNPFNSTTSIRFSLSIEGMVRLSVYDLEGREVAKLIDKRLTSGEHEVIWDASSQPSGLYLVRLECAGYVDFEKLTLIR